MNITDSPPAIVWTQQEQLFSWISDSTLSYIAPVAVYWLLSGFYHIIDVYELAEKHRIHTPQEVDEKNHCTAMQVVRAVVMQHIIQTATAWALDKYDGPHLIGNAEYTQWKIQRNLGVSAPIASALYWYVFPAFKQLVAFFMLDTWQYFFHRFMHLNKWAYRNFHSVHHRLYVPYAFGALYNSLIEGFLLDTAGTGLASIILGLSPRENIILYTFSTIKTVDDHCGYEFPWDPLQWIFPNRATYHDIHHQQFGIKTNFSQPFFIHWDQFFGSVYEKTDEYVRENKRIRLENAAKSDQERAHRRKKEENERLEKQMPKQLPPKVMPLETSLSSGASIRAT